MRTEGRVDIEVLVLISYLCSCLPGTQLERPPEIQTSRRVQPGHLQFPLLALEMTVILPSLHFLHVPFFPLTYTPLSMLFLTRS